MIVYGGDALTASVGELLALVRERAASSHPGAALEALVVAGQFEQGALDARVAAQAQASRICELAAAWFVACYGGDSAEPARRELLRAVDTPVDGAGQAIAVKAPEGFAFYGLDACAYADTAQHFAAQVAVARVRVVGLLSIGTALSAVVAAVLRARGFTVERICVRPSGHPFARVVELPPALGSDQMCVIVDEGPGLSGSSLAGAAMAARRAGHDWAATTLVPAHGHGPGAQASGEVRGVWRRCRVLPARAHGLPERIATAAAEGAPASAPVDLGGGRWCDVVGWHDRRGVGPRLEQPKWLVTGRSGAPVVAKFQGLDLVRAGGRLTTRVERTRERLCKLAGLGFTPAPERGADGWTATPWISDGVGASAGAVGTVLGNYLRATCGTALDGPERAAAFERLRQILSHNAPALCGGSIARLVDGMLRRVRPEALVADLPRFCDGRMGQHEWRVWRGRPVKFDCAGHADDHTAVGAQSILWDIAGADVAWDFDDRTSRDLIRSVTSNCVSAELIGFYKAAYCAFWGGVAALEADSGRADQSSYEAARDWYAARLAALLARWAA